jgi:hypothetical protein
MSDCISGYCKSGFCISGYCISGFCISGYCISGYCISGYCISDYCISGYSNIGLLSYRVFVQDCSDFCHIGLLHIGLLHIGFLHVGFLFMMARVFVYRVIDIWFLTVGLLISGFDLESHEAPHIVGQRHGVPQVILKVFYFSGHTFCCQTL